jgi:hypothetical protein
VDKKKLLVQRINDFLSTGDDPIEKRERERSFREKEKKCLEKNSVVPRPPSFSLQKYNLFLGFGV